MDHDLPTQRDISQAFAIYTKPIL